MNTAACRMRSTTFNDEKVQRLIHQFRSSLPCLWANNRLTGGTPHHVVEPALRFSFEEGEIATLLEREEVRFVVHHGKEPTLPGIRTARLPDEHLIAFVSRRRGFVEFSKRDLYGIFSGLVRDWSQVGETPGPIRLFAHSVPLNAQVLDAMVWHNFNVRIRVPIERLPSYELLSDAAARNSASLVFGLRSAFVDTSQTVPILVNGLAPWKTGEGSGWPNLPMYVVWRSNDAAPIDALVAYFDLVRANLAADAHMLSRYQVGGYVRSLAPAAHSNTSAPRVPRSALAY